MFVLEKFFSDLRAREENWERACQKWIDAGERDGYNHRDERDYRHTHPRPSQRIHFYIRSGMVAILIGVFIGFLFMIVKAEVSKPDKPKEEPKVAQVSDKNCQNFNKGDKVRIQYGDFTGNVGTIIGGCESGNHYQVKIDPDSKANVSSDNNTDPVDVGGWTISVDDQKNLVVIEEPKKE